MSSFTILSGSANRALTDAVASALGIHIGGCDIARFPDGEVHVRLCEPVRRKNVYIIQPTAPPVDEHLIELLAIADACRRAAAAHVTAVVPYFGYARADKRHGQREAIAASMVAALIQAVGIAHVITVDLHAAQIEGFFRIPVDNLSPVRLLVEVVQPQLAPDTVVVSPDAGRVRTASTYAHALGTSVVVLHKQRESGALARVTHLVGDVRDRPCLIIDDMVSTGSTLAEAVATLRQAGAQPNFTIAATHGLLLEGAHDRLSDPSIRAVYVTDSVDVPTFGWPQIKVISLAPLLAEAIRRHELDGSIEELC